MQIEFIGQLNWSIQLPVRPEGLLLLGLYLILVGLALIRQRRTFLALTRQQWLVFGGLALLTMVLSNVLLWRFSAPGFQPVPDRPQEVSVPLTPLLSGLPLLLAASWLGIGPTLVLSALSGFIQAGFQSGEITQRFEVIAFGLLVVVFTRQNYRGRAGRWLRHPLIAAPVAALLSWPVMLPSFFVYTPGATLAALNYAWPLFMAGLIPTVTAGFIGGVMAEAIQPVRPSWTLPRGPQTAPPWARTLTGRLMWAFITFIVISIIVLVYVASSIALSDAKRQSIAQMSRDALSAARDIPSFFHTGQGLISEFAADAQLRSSDPAVRQARLLSALRTGPFFDQLLLYDNAGRVLDQYPSDNATPTLPEEQLLISRTLQTRAPQMSRVYAVGQDTLMTFIAPVGDPTGEQAGVLLGRTRLQVNPVIERLRDGLQNTLGEGNGYLVDENNNIVVHRKADRILSAWSLDTTLKPMLTTPEGGAAYEDRFADGTPRLLFVQPAAGTDWLVIIELPTTSVLQLALQISAPLLILLLLIGLVAGLGVMLLTRAITRPIKDLSKAAAHISQGQLDQPIARSGEDEVGQLSYAFEQMRLALKGRVDDLSLLLRVSQTVSSSLDLERGVPPLLAGAMQATPASIARLVILTDSGLPEAVLASGEGPQSLTALDQALVALGVLSEVPILIDNVNRARSRALLDPNLVGPGVKALAVLPVRRQAKPIGVMWLGYAEARAYGESEVNVLGTLAVQAAVLIENAHLFQMAEGGRRRLQAVLTSTSDAVIVTDKDDRVLLCNPATEVAFRLEPDATIGQSVTEVWPDESMQRLFMADDSLQTRTEEILLPDGRTLYGSASAIHSGDHQVLGRVAVLRDITHLKELDAMKSEFVATVSHDLRAPLTYMRGYATMLPMVGSLTPKQQDYIEKVMAGIEQMTELIDDLLDLGRIEAGVGIVRETCSLADTVRTVIDSMTGQALSRGLTLTLDRMSENIIYGDQGLLRHAITNLVDNAIKYTPAGGAVTVSVEQRDAAMVVAVKDTGIGIAPADQVRLFERFYRVKRRETIDIKGTGLGLAIVKSIAEWHRGRVWVESQLGEGSTFYILVPVDCGDVTA
jgi:PAS domain S-box-containing protein